MGNAEIRARLGLKDRTHLRERYVAPALAEGIIEPTIPDKPSSRFQKYRLTAKGAALLTALREAAKYPIPSVLMDPLHRLRHWRSLLDALCRDPDLH